MTAGRLAIESLAADDATGWFDRLYAAAERGEAVIPWDLGAPNPLLERWAHARTGPVGRALVVGAGLGSDSEYVAELGFTTTAFDISAAAVRAARLRFPASAVTYVVADLLDPPAEWNERFDLVVESRTVQSLPDPPRRTAITNVADFVAPGGTLVVIAGARAAHAAVDGPPWPLTREEIGAFAADALCAVRVESIPSPREPAPDTWLAEFARPS